MVVGSGGPGIGRLDQGKEDANDGSIQDRPPHSQLGSICLDQVAPVVEGQSFNKNQRLLKAHGWGWGFRHRNGSSGPCPLQCFLMTCMI